MTLAAPKSRRGKFGLVLVIAAALVAVTAALLWANSAQAQLPQTDTELDQTPASPIPGTVVPGGAVNYHGEADLSLGLGIGEDLTIELDYDSALGNPEVACNPAADDEGVFATQAFCNWDTVVTSGVYEIDVVGIATADLIAPSGRVCADQEPNSNCDSEVGDNEKLLVDSDGDVGTLTFNASGLVTAPIDAENWPGLSHDFVFTLQPNVDCQSGDNANDGSGDDQTDVVCSASDVVPIGCTNSTFGDPIVTNSGIGAVTTVTVTVTNNGTEDTCTIGLALTANAGNDDNADDVDFNSATSTKTYAVSGELRHRDDVDAATEDESGTTDPYCTAAQNASGLPGWSVDTPLNPSCGLLAAQHDGDDATGSFHEVCIIGSTLTDSANSSIINWNITPVAGDPTVSPAAIAFGGPNDEPCVRWGSNNSGSQQITATVDAGPGPGFILYWDAASDAALIKEWNDLDDTLLINVTGNVGDMLAENTGELAAWASRDCELTGFCARADRDGTTISQTGVVIAGPIGKGFIDAAGVSLIDYTLGSHTSGPSDAYAGPVDGAAQTYTVSGVCGSARVEDPTTGTVKILKSGQTSADVLSSDKGVGLQIVPNADGAIETTPSTADCLPGAQVCVSVATSEDNDFGSPPLDTVPAESVCVQFVGGEIGNKHPGLAWAGQRKSLDADWSVEAVVDGDTVRVCPWDIQGSFTVRYVQGAGSPGALTDGLGAGTTTGQDFMEVTVQVAEATVPGADGDPNTGCRSSVLYEAEGEGQVDVSAFVVTEPGGSVISDEQDFLIFYMKLLDITMDPADAQNVNVSEGTEVTATVRGWTVTNSSNCAQLPAGPGDLPAGRCVFPDDWVYLATGQRGATSVPVATVDRPEWDLWGGSIGACNTVAGPLSMLDLAGCNTGVAPYVGTPVQRDTIFPDGNITPDDAPMPVSLVKFELVGSNGVVCATNPSVAVDGCSGFIRTVDSSADQFNRTHIPADAWIPPTTNGFPLPQGYSWNTWGPAGQPNTGLYNFWEAAMSGDEVISCGGANTPCNDSADTGGYKWIGVYSDNHGVAKATVFGDADLTFNQCASSGPIPELDIVFVNGNYCEPGDEVGTASVVARADYPDKRKHPQVRTDEVDYTFTWAGIKEVTVVPSAMPQFNYIVLSVTDRDGYCGQAPTTHSNLHSVLGERVTFLIESTDGRILDDANGNAAALLGTNTLTTADVTTFQASDTNTDTSDDPLADDGLSVLPLVQTDPDACQAWIHVSSSLLDRVDVVIKAFDPEGTVTFDKLINEPPEPTPEPTPTPMQSVLWGDVDCDGAVDLGDAIKIGLDGIGDDIDQESGCPAIGDDVSVTFSGNTTSWKWGDVDCDGTVDLGDAIKIGLWGIDAQINLTGACPGPGAPVEIPA